MEHWMKNEYYKTQEEYLFAIAAAMAEEYRAIVDAGFVLQIDDPDLADAWQMHPR
jgi:5-methyltetrahydropteroyltriglutamate--homocysteine methyltransferase